MSEDKQNTTDELSAALLAMELNAHDHLQKLHNAIELSGRDIVTQFSQMLEAEVQRIYEAKTPQEVVNGKPPIGAEFWSMMVGYAHLGFGIALQTFPRDKFITRESA